jgi:hypothetical protein
MPQPSSAHRKPTLSKVAEGSGCDVFPSGNVKPFAVPATAPFSERVTITVEINVAQVVRALLLGAAALAAAFGAPKVVNSVASADIRITISSAPVPSTDHHVVASAD